MRTAFIFLTIAILLLLLFWWKTDVQLSGSTIDIHVHDTYFVIDRLQFVLFFIVILGIFFTLGGLFGTRFRNKAFLITFLVFLAAGIYIFYPLFELI
jgi:heme/copper-type cytochrome/quinol oxidase subunit 1